jgi:hypothetical protein
MEIIGLAIPFGAFTVVKKLGTQKIRLPAVILFSLAILGADRLWLRTTRFQTLTINVTGNSIYIYGTSQSTSVVLSTGNE